MKKIQYKVLNLDCAGCAGKIQHKASTFKGVKTAEINLYKKEFILETDEQYNEKEFLTEINNFADSIEPGTKIVKADENTDKINSEDELAEEERKQKREKFMILLGVFLFILSILAKYYCPVARLPLAVIAYIVLGFDVIVKSAKNMTRGNFMDENFLMTIATLGAFYLNETSEAVGVMLFYKVGEFFQDKAVTNSRRSIKKLLDIRPEYANIKDHHGHLIQISPRELKVGDIITVKAGEKIPVDGIVIKGKSTLNTSALTGESLPVNVESNSSVLSGSLNGEGTLEIEVTKLFEDSTVNKIIEMVENAGNKKAKAEKFITKFARFYTPVVVLLAVFVALVIPAFTGNFNLWLGRALIFLVISCPCALVLSVPLTFFTSIGQASKEGILIKGGNYLEALNSTQAVVFDKTGTLTEGNFIVDGIHTLHCSKDDLIKYAQIGEFYSNHPIGKAILNSKKLDIDEKLISDYKELSGYGVVTFYNNKKILVGNFKLMKKCNIETSEINYPGTVIYVANDNIFLGYITISDKIKNDSQYVIPKLNDNNIDTYMLTGDNAIIGNAVGQKLGIKNENIFASLLPQDKVTKLEEIKKKYQGNVVFVGDGVNDAPVLSLSDIGIAMGGTGSDIAVESADIVIMKDKITKIIDVLKIAKVNRKVVLQNIIFALGIKVIVMLLGVLGIANMWMAIFADVGVSLLAVLNSSWGIKRYLKK
ncbi:heavy metal translocating P-type ATPase [Fusobacterium sp.]|uniref:heavy metal translocating P-type ATPase n=1 Tax=Fusobacterium sp. TaxID=68766 RepID=UPI00396C5BCC